MIDHHLSGKYGGFRQLFSICLVLLMVCTISIPAFGAEQNTGETADSSEITDNSYSEGNLNNSQTVENGEMLTEPESPVAEEKAFDGEDTSDEKTEETGEVTTGETEQPAEETAETAEKFSRKADIDLQSEENSSEDINFIVVEKRFSGITEQQIPDNFQINVKSANEEYILTKTTDSWEQILDNDSIIWRWEIMGVGTGSYIVTEQNETITDYNVETNGEGTVEVKAADITIVESGYETTCSHLNWPVKIDGDTNVLFAASLTKNRGSVVISREPLSASQRAAVSAYVTSRGGVWKSPVYFYSIQEQIENGSGFVIYDATITYDFDKGEVIIGNTSNWQHVMTLGYSISQASNPEISITNTYKPTTRDILVRKEVTGGLGDRQKDFSFTYSYTNTSGTQNTGSFTLKNEEEYIITGVPIGSELKLEETNADGYATVAEYGEEDVTVYGDKGSPVKIVTIVITADKTKITVINNKEAVPDTGVYLNTRAFALTFIFAAAGAVVWIICKCKRRYS